VPGLYLALAPDFTIVAVSDAYLRATMTERAAILGRDIFDVFPDNPDDPAATGVRNLRVSLERVRRDRVPDAMPVQKYDVQRPASAGGGFEERYWSPVNSPVLGEDGGLLCIIHRVEDVTDLVGLRRRATEEGRPPEAELFVLAQELRDANARLRESNEELSRLRAELEDRVRERTARLEAANETLAAEVQERRRAEDALRTREELFRAAFEDTNVAMVLLDLEHRFIRVNAAFAGLFGYSADEMLGMAMKDVTHPDDLPESYARREGLLAGEAFFVQHKRYLHRDGQVLWAVTNVSLVRDARGKPLLYVGQVQDVTERRKLEDQFRQAQKLEAVGRLAGGVAHDFNNLLTIINGYSEVMLATSSRDDPARPALAAIRDAGERAAALTSQLLAFSRKSIVEPHVLDLNDVVRQSERLLRRLIGEDVVLATALAPELPQVKADPTQVEQIVINLAVNARDAMPRGGRLTIETRDMRLREEDRTAFPDLEAGRYVQLAVSDTGVGMTDEVKSRLFEPFFTTKEASKGTGLGLAMVYGAVKSHRGHISIYSELGIGTTCKILLPATNEQPRSKSGETRAVPAGTETVLLVEDEEGVRRIARLALETQGYAVLAAANGTEALRTADGHRGPIHLLVTDVVMPGMSGREVAETLRAHRPGLKTLYVSGYTDDAVVRHGIVEATDAFLQKPFTPLGLARKVRSVLDDAAG
jgi:PAS domain S-box-containing protein